MGDLPPWSRPGSAQSGSGVEFVIAIADLPDTPATGTHPLVLVLEDFALRGWDGAAWRVLSGSASDPGGGSTGGSGSAPAIASTIADLNALFDGAPPADAEGLIAYGSGLDEAFLPLIYDSVRGQWVSEPIPTIRCTDQNGPLVQFFAKRVLGWDVFAGTPLLPNQSWYAFSSPRKFNSILAAGLHTEYRHHGWAIQDTAGNKANVGAALYQYAPGDQQVSVFGNPISGFVAATPAPLHVGGPNNLADYHWSAPEWDEFDLSGLVTKSTIHPVMTGFLDPGGSPTGTAAVIDYTLFIRFVSEAA